ncbi:MAG: hypothetical protein HRT73_11905, partial [Flavobacteriales bacterium]|nr:hypothetical protein [Flavobacteriales bacterium]
MRKFSLTLFVKADKENVKGEIPVYLKIKSNNSKSSMGLSIWVDKERWKITSQFRLTRINDEKKIRSVIDEILIEVNATYEKLTLKGLPFSAI